MPANNRNVSLSCEQALGRHKVINIKQLNGSRLTSPAFMKASTAAPASADQEVNLGVSLQRAGDLKGAVECFRRALKIDPSSFAAYNNLGGVFASLRDWETALIFAQAAAAVNPASAEIHGNIGDLYLKQNKPDAAAESYRQATTLKQDEPRYLNALGNALRQAGQDAEAEACMRKALSIDPGYAEAYANLAFLYYMQQRPASLVEDYYRKAIACKPDLAQAHVNLSQCLLRRGAFAAGWAEQEWRWKWKEFPSPKRNFTQPQWKGESIQGARILLHAEQGFGDTIQFLRYVPMVAERGARIILEVHPELRSLLSNADDVHVISRGDALPAFDWQCPLLSLPLAFGTELESVPATVPYLTSESEAPKWLQKERARDLHVGLVWAGSGINVIDRERSLTLAALSALWQVEGVSFYSLQRGPISPDGESSSLHFAGSLPQVGDFAATASAISHLDLVVSVDTSVAHLAGALGKPVWILLPVRADWRWLTNRRDNPWYPTATLFRQTVEGDWNPVIASLTAELSRVAAMNAVTRINRGSC